MIEKLSYWLQRTIPNVYDDSMSLYELMEAVRKKLDEVIDAVNGYDPADIEAKLGALLQEWYDNGKLADIINNTIFKQIQDDITDLKNRKVDVDLPFVDLLQYKTVNNKTFTQAFQECLQMAKTDGGVHIVIPANLQISLDAELVVYANTTIAVGKNTVITRNHDGYLLMNGERSLTYTGYNGNGNITIEGGIWNINGVNKPSTASGFAFAHASNLTIRDLTIKDANSHSIEFNSTNDALVENCNFLGLSATAENLTAEAIQLDFAGPDGFPAFGSYDRTCCKNITVRSCYFGSSGSAGTTSVARGLGSHGAFIGGWHDNIVVDDCTFDGLTDYCLNVYNWNNFTLCNSKLLNSPGGVILYVPFKTTDQTDVNGNVVSTWQDCRNFDIYGNLFKGIKDKNHIRLYGTANAKIINVSIADNHIESATGDAPCIFGEYFESVTVLDNTIENIQNTGVALAYGNEAKVIGNKLKNLNGNGVSITGATTEATVSNNSIENVDQNGVLISDNVVDFTLTGNRTKNVNRSNGAYDHYHIVNACSNGALTGNVAKDGSNRANYALYITGTCSNIVRSANVFRGVGSIRPIYDTTVSQNGGDLI